MKFLQLGPFVPVTNSLPLLHTIELNAAPRGVPCPIAIVNNPNWLVVGAKVSEYAVLPDDDPKRRIILIPIV